MRHRLKGRQLSRNASHRLALFRNLSRALITHESITTTVPKCKELRPFVEKLITLARKAHTANDGTDAGRIAALHYRRQAITKLGPMAGTGVYDKDDELTETNDTVLKKLFNVVGPRFAARPGGYTRILKLHQRRLGDGGEQAIIEFMKEGEGKVEGSTTKAVTTTAPTPMPALATTPAAPSVGELAPPVTETPAPTAEAEVNPAE